MVPQPGRALPLAQNKSQRSQLRREFDDIAHSSKSRIAGASARVRG